MRKKRDSSPGSLSAKSRGGVPKKDLAIERWLRGFSYEFRMEGFSFLSGESVPTFSNESIMMHRNPDRNAKKE
jgi:hypothetical protein